MLSFGLCTLLDPIVHSFISLIPCVFDISDGKINFTIRLVATETRNLRGKSLCLRVSMELYSGWNYQACICFYYNDKCEGIFLEKVQITPLKFGQCPYNPPQTNISFILLSPTMSVCPIYHLTRFIFFLFPYIQCKF